MLHAGEKRRRLKNRQIKLSAINNKKCRFIDMIDKEQLNIDWINKVSKSHRNADYILVEKVIRALLLLEGLSESEIPFVFKGGTSLMLHFNSSKRLSKSEEHTSELQSRTHLVCRLLLEKKKKKK